MSTALPAARVLWLTALAMGAFAGNSLLCRQALQHTAIDPASFTAVRLISGAAVLWALVRWRGQRSAGDWASATALFVYAAAFSFAYLSLSAGTGALLLFGAVQATMLGWGLWRGQRLSRGQVAGLVLAMGGLSALLLPGVSAPPVAGALLMLAAGAAWGVYSLRGRGAGDPTAVTAGNFQRAGALALVLGLAGLPWARVDPMGLVWALCSGALTSGLGYAVWYAALKGLHPTSSASVQLSVPVLTALGGVALLGEPVTLRLALCSLAILGGIAWVIAGQGKAR
ncbi:MAG: DMT family transporter [Betaproteobacteria bacterium]